MALAHHYRILGLRTGASFGDVKLAYRNLARLYHPDVNPGDHLAKEKFIQVTQSYQALADALPQSTAKVKAQPAPKSAGPVGRNRTSSPGQTPQAASPQSKGVSPQRAASVPTSAPHPETKAPGPRTQPSSDHADADQTLKQSGFQQLQEFFRSQRYPRAVALVEGLAHRFPDDPEVRQWQAITYYRWGHYSLNTGNLQKAEACLKKAWRVDPHNQSLRQSLQHEFQRLEAIRESLMAQAQ